MNRIAGAAAIMMLGLMPTTLVRGQTQTQAVAIPLEQAVFVTCREAHVLPVEARQRLAYFLAEFAARSRGVTIPDDDRGGQLAVLVRGGCTLSPDAHLFAVIDKAIVAEQAKLQKRQ